MKLLVDVNLSPAWVGFFAANNIEARHWADVGCPNAEDDAVMRWARTIGWIVFTHDLDFGTLLALAGELGPNVVQVLHAGRAAHRPGAARRRSASPTRARSRARGHRGAR